MRSRSLFTRTGGTGSSGAVLTAVVLGSAAAASTLGLGSPFHFLLPGLVLIVLGVAFVMRHPGLAVASLPALIPPPQFAKVFAYEVALIAVAAVIFIEGMRRRERWWMTLDPIEVAVMAFMGWAVLTGFWVTDLWWYAFGIRKLGIGVLSLWVAWRVSRWMSPETSRLGIVIGAASLAGYTMTVSAGELAHSLTGFSRTAATNLGWGTSNFIAALLVLMLPTAILVAVEGKRLAARLLGWMALPLAGLVMAVAASRGGTLLTLILMGGFFARERFTRRTWALVLAAGLAITLLLIGPGAERLLERFTDEKEFGSYVIRLMYFRAAWGRLLDHLPFGMGQGQGYSYVDRLATEDPHNYWLVVGPELGIPGLLLWITILVMLWKRAGRLSKSPETRVAGRAIQMTLIISQLNSLFEPTFQGLQYHFLFYWIMGIHLGSEAHAKRRAGTSGDDVPAAGWVASELLERGSGPAEPHPLPGAASGRATPTGGEVGG